MYVSFSILSPHSSFCLSPSLPSPSFSYFSLSRARALALCLLFFRPYVDLELFVSCVVFYFCIRVVVNSGKGYCV